MIIINTGIPKSGTSLLFRYQNDLINEVFESNGIAAFRSCSNHGYLPEVDKPSFRAMRDISTTHGGFVAKLHTGPNQWIRRLIEEHEAKVTFSYRDPRDVMLSAVDHGVRTRNGLDRSGAFGNIHTLEDAAREVRQWTSLYDQWQSSGQALMIRYEDFVENKRDHIKRLVDYLGLDVSDAAQTRIHDRHESTKEKAWNFNKGTAFRWKDEMSAKDVALCNDLVSEEITRLGYDLG